MVPCGDPGLRKTRPLNNNNRGNNNNRRRSRGNNGRPQGGGQQLNRIDSRARGNAPQMLEKYRKLAHDAHLNGDRVTAEYYLQFADHYFRVIADTRVRQEESRGRRDERWGENGDGPPREDADDGNEFSVEADFPAFDQPPVYTRRDREDRGGERGSDRNGDRNGDQSGDQRRRDERGPRHNSLSEDAVADNNGNDNGAFGHDRDEGEDTGDQRGFEQNQITPGNNPFVRDNRGPRPARAGREERRPRREGRSDERFPADRGGPERGGAERLRPERSGGERPFGERGANPRGEDAPALAPVSVGLDPSLLPPAISASRRDADVPGEEALATAPRRRARRKPVEDAAEPIDTQD